MLFSDAVMGQTYATARALPVLRLRSVGEARFWLGGLIATLIASAWIHDAVSQRPALQPSVERRLVLPAAAEVSPSADERVIADLVREHRIGTLERQRSMTRTIYEESVAAGVDPLMVASIVAKESSFRPHAVSHAGAVGLMQLRPFVARDLAERGSIRWSGPESLRSPRINVRLGISYYQELMEHFDGNAETALTAYNFGPTRVRHQLREGRYRGSSYALGVLDLYEELRARRSRFAG